MAYGSVATDLIQTSTPNASLGAKNASTLQNRLIDAGFTINQRGYVTNTALSAGTYAHDRWKAGASGCTYTFTQGSAGVPIVITITAGSLQQVIEGANMPEGGTYVLSWTGTAQARFNGGTYGSSPLAVTGITAGANTTIEFNTGTLSFPQLEVGSSATGFEYRQYGQELALCQRYYEKTYAMSTVPGSALPNGSVTVSTGLSSIGSGAGYGVSPKFVVTKRASPTVNIWSRNGVATAISTNISLSTSLAANSGVAVDISDSGFGLLNNSGSAATLVDTMIGFHYTASAEL